MRIEDGFALPAAVLLLVLVSGVLLHDALHARVERRQAIHAGAALRAEAAADAGVAHAVVRLRALQRRSIVGAPDPVVHELWNRLEHLHAGLDSVGLSGGSYYRVQLSDASAKLPLNHATEDELRRLFLVLGADAREADIAAQSILDWRDTDELHRPRGAEWDDYYRHHAPDVRPRNGPFTSLTELKDVRGLERLYPRAGEFLTVYEGGRVNLNTAPLPVLRALPGLGDEAVAWIVTRRRSEPIRSLLELEAALPPQERERMQREYPLLALRAAFEPQAFDIVSTGSTAGQALRRTIHAIAVRAGPTIEVVRRWEQ